ncbi:MAG: hypothetical protein AAFP20_20775, partial [Cyanobacteria bacterium J06614_10]
MKYAHTRRLKGAFRLLRLGEGPLQMAGCGMGAIALTLTSLSPVAASPSQKQAFQQQTFQQWCEASATLPVPTRRTVAAIMQSVTADDCATATAQLRELTELNLSHSHLSDLRPIAAL